MKRILMALMLMPFMALAETLVMDGRTFTTGGSKDWFVDTSVSYDGGSSLRSGGIGGDGVTWMTLDINENMEVIFLFRWKVSSEEDYDVLTWYVDGVEQSVISGEVDWKQESVRLAPGAHIIKWAYSRDDEDTEGSNCGWVDALTIIYPSLLEGLVAKYDFDGNAKDSSGNGYDCDVHGATLVSDRFGNPNCAYYFNGQAQCIRYEDSDISCTKDFSISLWFKTAVTLSSHGSSSTAWNPGNYVCFPNHGGSGAGYGFKVGTDGIQVTEHGTCYLPTVLNYKANIGTGWNHVVVTLANNGNPVLYLNGEYVATGSGSSRIKSMRIAEGFGGGCWGYYTGSIDEVREYNRALSANEVKALYKGTPKMLFVNGATGSDSNDGFTADFAKATIQSAVDISYCGDTILVAAGTYAPISTGNKQISIIGEGAANTIIDAQKMSRCVVVLEDAYSIVATNTIIEGFSLIHGRSYNKNGGCVMGGTIKNCIISDGEAVNKSGGGAGGAMLVNCLVKNNSSTCGGGVAASVAINCTFVENSATVYGASSHNSSLINCILYGGSHTEMSDWGDVPLCKSFGLKIEHIYEQDPHFVDAPNNDYRLVKESPCIDAGDNSYVTSATDLYGNPRITGTQVDLGAIERVIRLDGGPYTEISDRVEWTFLLACIMSVRLYDRLTLSS